MDIFWSICLYYLIFFIAFCLFFVADNINNNTKAKLYIMAGVLVLSAFAGARDLSVGIDTYRTVIARFIMVESTSGIEDIVAIKEPLYRYMSFFLHKITDNPCIFLFVIQLLTAGSVAASLYKLRKKAAISIGMTVYMLFFYQYSFNIMRQSLAAAILLFAFVEYLQGSNLKSVLLAFLSMQFHSSAIIGIALLIIITMIAKIENKNARTKVILLSILTGVSFLLNWKILLSFLVSNNILIDHYFVYGAIFSQEVGYGLHYINAGGTVFLSVFGRAFGLLLILFMLNGKEKMDDFVVRTLEYSCIVSFILYSALYLMFNTGLGHRLVLYLDFLQVLLFARVLFGLEQGTAIYSNGKIRLKSLNSLICVLYPFAYNYILIMLRYSFGTLPYMISKWL